MDKPYIIRAAKPATFDFVVPPAKTVYRIPLMESLTIDEARQIDEGADTGDEKRDAQARGMNLIRLFERSCPVIGRLTQAQFKALMEAYTAASSVTAGESVASSD